MMKYEKEMLDIQKVVKETIELTWYGKKNDDSNQFQVKSIDGEELPEEDILLLSIKKRAGTGVLEGYCLTQIDQGNYFGKLYVHYGKKKKGLFGRESFKVLKAFDQSFHKSGLESGEEEPLSLRTVMER